MPGKEGKMSALKSCICLTLLLALLCALVGCGASDVRLPGGDSNRPVSRSTGSAQQTEPAETEEPQPAEEPTDTQPEETMPPVVVEEEKNTTSKHGVPHLGRYRLGFDECGYSPVKRQGSWLYYVGGNAIKKIPVGGSAGDAVVLLDNLKEQFGTLYEIQIVGDWVYFTSFYQRDVVGGMRMYTTQLSRVRTDGSGAETVTHIMPNFDGEYFNTFVVRDNVVYFTTIDYDQQSASTYTFYSELWAFHLDLWQRELLYHIEIDNPNTQACAIIAYTDDAILMKDYSTKTLYLCDGTAVTAAPEGLQQYGGADFYSDGKGNFVSYQVGYLRRYSPANGYEPEEFDFTVNPDGVAQVSVSDLIFLEDGTILSNYTDLNTKRGMQTLKDGVHTTINNDWGNNLSYPGDGYLYYTYNNDLYRVRLDGSGWEQLNW